MEFDGFVTVLAIMNMKKKPLSLVSLCLGVIGRHFEDIIEDLAEIAAIPSTMKVKVCMPGFIHIIGCSYSENVPFD